MIGPYVLRIALVLASEPHRCSSCRRAIRLLYSGRYRLVATRVVLIRVGAAIGYLGSLELANPNLATAAFVLGVSVVHIPAACVLLLEGLRREAPS